MGFRGSLKKFPVGFALEEDVRVKYRGLRVSWTGRLGSIRKSSKRAYSISVNSNEDHVLIFCTCSELDSSLLHALQDAPVHVTGVIKRASAYEIEVEDATVGAVGK